MSFGGSEPFKATKIWNDLVDHMKTNLEPRKKRWKLQTFENCFRGSEIVELLQKYVYNHPEIASDPSKVQIKSLAQKLLESQVIECASEKSHKVGSFDQTGRLYRFCDNSKLSNLDNLTKDSVSRSEKKKKRLSFDRLNINRRSMKRSSLRHRLDRNENCSSLEKISGFGQDINNNDDDGLGKKRRNSYSELSGSQEIDCTSETPRKYKRRSLKILTRSGQKSKLANQTNSDISQRFHQDVWFEVVLSNLLKMIDLSFLEDLIDVSDQASDRAEITNSPYKGLLDSTGQECRQHGKDTAWKVAAVACFDAMHQHPLSHNKDFQNHGKIALTEVGISTSLAKFYSSLNDSLIPGRFQAVVEEILVLASTKRRNVCKVLCLMFLLLPKDRQEHLKRLLNFFHKSLISQTKISKEQRRKYLCRAFVDGMFPSHFLQHSKENAETLLDIMIDVHGELFQTPPSIISEVKRHVTCLQSGYNLPVISLSCCKRINIVQYQEEKFQATRQSLLDLINFIMDDLNMSVKIKEFWLSEFQKHHMDVFALQFPNGEF